MRYKHEFFKVLSTITAISFLYNTLSYTGDVTANEITSDFDPYDFYQEIINEKRPKGAEAYRFLDLDGDGKEELLIGGEQSGTLREYVIMALYTCSEENNMPIPIFIQAPEAGSGHYTVKSDVICYSLSPNMHGQYIGHFKYRLFKGELNPICAYVYDGHAHYKSEDKELISNTCPLPSDYDFSNWNTITTEEFYSLYGGNADTSVRFSPWMESFYTYDAQKEFNKTNTENPIAVTGLYGYDELIQRYKDILSSPSNVLALEVTQGTHCLNNDMYSYFWKEYSYTEPGFVLTDLNADGIKEMATGCVEKDGTFKLFDLYTIYENRIIHLVASGLRDSFSISEDNEILESGSSGASDGISMAYKLNEGKLEPIRVMPVEKGKYYYYENFGTLSECKTELTREEWLEKSQTLFKSNRNQDVVLFKDWYPGMRINEDSNGVDSTNTLNDIDKNQPTPKETITPKPAPSNTPTSENAETKKPYDTSLLDEDKLNLILDQMVEGRPGETVKVGITIESKELKYVDTVQLKIEYNQKLNCMLDKAYGKKIEDGTCIIWDSSSYLYSIDEYATVIPSLLFTIPSDAKPGTVYDIVWSDPESFDGFYFLSTHDTLQNYDCNFINGSIVVLNPDGTLPENISKESDSTSLTTEPVDTSKPTASPSLSNTPELNTYNVTLKNGNQHQITADQNELRYKTNNPDVAVVSSKGLVTAIGEGTAIISVINMDGYVAQLNVTVESIQSIIYGDFNNDGKVDITDLSAISIYLVDKKQLSNAQSKAADVTGDGVVDLSDLAHLRSFLSKKVGWLGNASNILA